MQIVAKLRIEVSERIFCQKSEAVPLEKEEEIHQTDVIF